MYRWTYFWAEPVLGGWTYFCHGNRPITSRIREHTCSQQYQPSCSRHTRAHITHAAPPPLASAAPSPRRPPPAIRPADTSSISSLHKVALASSQAIHPLSDVIFGSSSRRRRLVGSSLCYWTGRRRRYRRPRRMDAISPSRQSALPTTASSPRPPPLSSAPAASA